MSTNLHDAKPDFKTISLVEDKPDDQKVITEAFLSVDRSLNVHAISNGSDVLPYLQRLTDSQLPQLILLYYNLPQLDGSKVCQTLAES